MQQIFGIMQLVLILIINMIILTLKLQQCNM